MSGAHLSIEAVGFATLPCEHATAARGESFASSWFTCPVGPNGPTLIRPQEGSQGSLWTDDTVFRTAFRPVLSQRAARD